MDAAASVANENLAVAPVCITFNGANGAWRRAKAVHFYGSGIVNWVKAMCKEPESKHYGVHADEVRTWRAAGFCDKRVSRAKFIRFLRDPLG